VAVVLNISETEENSLLSQICMKSVHKDFSFLQCISWTKPSRKPYLVPMTETDNWHGSAKMHVLHLYTIVPYLIPLVRPAIMEARWHSGRVSVSWSRGCGFDSRPSHLLSTGQAHAGALQLLHETPDWFLCETGIVIIPIALWARFDTMEMTLYKYLKYLYYYYYYNH
jgi:hypothetical protein